MIFIILFVIMTLIVCLGNAYFYLNPIQWQKITKMPFLKKGTVIEFYNKDLEKWESLPKEEQNIIQIVSKGKKYTLILNKRTPQNIYKILNNNLLINYRKIKKGK